MKKEDERNSTNEKNENNDVKKGELELRNEIVSMLLNMGCRTNLLGFDYLVDTIIYMMKNTDRHVKYSKEVLVYLSNIHNATTQAIGNAIRHIIDDLWNVGRIDVVNKALNILVFRKNEKPSATIFINTIVKLLSLNYIYINEDFEKLDD